MRGTRAYLSYRCTRAWLGAAALLVLIGCANSPPRPAFDARDAGLPSAVELDAVPFFPQEDNWCGPAALATALQHSGIAVSPAQLAGEVYLPERKGTLQMELLAAVRSRDLLAYVLEPELMVLLREVAAGHPVVVLQNLGFDWLPRWHYAVVVGFDLSKEIVLLRSGNEKRRRTAFTAFDRTWARGGRWAAIALRPQHLPASASADRLIRAAHDLEITGNLSAAFDAYTAASAAWPEHFATHFALGNAAYQLGELQVAEAALRRATRLQPAMAFAWNNLAYVLAATGCNDEARRAAHCAAILAPHDRRVADTQQAIATSQRKSTTPCEPVVCEAALRPLHDYSVVPKQKLD